MISKLPFRLLCLLLTIAIINITILLSSAYSSEKEVEFLNQWEKIFKPVVGNNKGSDHNNSYYFYKIGNFVSGKYKDGDLMIILREVTGVICEKNACGGYNKYRYVVKNNKAIYLPRISDLGGASHILSKTYNLITETDSSYTIPSLENKWGFHEDITAYFSYGNGSLLLKYKDEKIGRLGNNSTIVTLYNKNVIKEWNKSDFRKIPLIKKIGQLYRAKIPRKESTKYFSYYDYAPVNYVDQNLVADIDNELCYGKYCSDLNKFYKFRPDGTYLEFRYYPDFYYHRYNQTLIWNKGESKQHFNKNYVLINLITKEEERNIIKGGLTMVAKTQTYKNLFYALQNENHPIYKKLFKSYKNSYVYGDDKHLSYKEFIKAKPLLFWPDPFGRVLTFANRRLFSFLAG